MPIIHKLFVGFLLRKDHAELFFNITEKHQLETISFGRKKYLGRSYPSPLTLDALNDVKQELRDAWEKIFSTISPPLIVVLPIAYVG